MTQEIVQSVMNFPIGKFISLDGGKLEFLIPANRLSKQEILCFFQKNSKVSEEEVGFWLWPQLKSEMPIAGNWVFEFCLPDESLISLSEIVGLWRQNLKVKFPIIIQVVENIAKYYGHQQDVLFFPSPFTIYPVSYTHLTLPTTPYV